MLTTINNTLITKLKPSRKPYDVRDDKLTGFLIRVNISGKLVFMCEYARGKRVTLGKVGVLTPAQARDRAKEILADVVKGIDPKRSQKKKSADTFKQFIENEYAPWVIANRKTGIETIARIKRCFFETFGENQLAEISVLHVEKWRTEKINSGCKPLTTNRDITCLKASLSKAVDWGFIERHPLNNLKPSKVDTNTKIRYLSREEEAKLRSVLDQREERIKKERHNANSWRLKRNYSLLPNLYEVEFVDHIKPMVLISLNTGLRRGELFNLKWDNVNFQFASIMVAGEVAKNGKTRHIPLNKEALEILTKWRNQTRYQNLVFPSRHEAPLNSIKKAWAGILKQSDIKNFRWHDLRHHFASRLVMSRVDLNTVRELLGHSDIQMTLRYAHLAPEHKADAVARLVQETN